MTLLRLGDEDGGLEPSRAPGNATLRRPHLQPAEPVREGDPARYTTIAGAPALSRSHRGRAAVTEVVAPYLEERYRDLVARYGSSRAAVMFELYGDPHEFAVRTTACRRSASPASASAASSPRRRRRTTPSTGGWC
jgi:hypothetical protein